MIEAPNRRDRDRAVLWAALFVFCVACSSTNATSKTTSSPSTGEIDLTVPSSSSAVEPQKSESAANHDAMAGGPVAAPASVASDSELLPAPLLRRLPAPTAANPSRGPENAPVVIQLFSDFQCPFCQMVATTLEQLERDFPGKLRIVWRNLPLPFHPHARLAAAASLEAYAQRGAPGFWQMHDLIFTGNEPDRKRLVSYAKKLGLDVLRFEKALTDGTHEASIDSDTKLAEAQGIRGTPSLVINEYYVVGAQPIEEFRRVVRVALDDARRKR